MPAIAIQGLTKYYGHVRGVEDLDMQVEQYLARLRGDVDAAYLAELLERLEVDPDRRIRDYSRGNKQKVGLVQAFMHRFGTFVAPVLAVFAVLQVARWATELEDGRFVLAPSTRGDVSGAALGRTVLGMGAIVLFFCGVGLAAGAWLGPAWAAPIAGAYLAVDFVFRIVAQAFDVPPWAASLSVFVRSGDPGLEGLRLTGQGVVLLAGLALLGMAVAGFRRQDLV